MSKKILTAEELAEEIKKKFKIKDVIIERKAVGLKKKERVEVWVRGNKYILKEFIKYLMELDYPHLAVISGSDLGNTVELIYHFSIYYGRKYQEIAINFSIELPKNDLTVPTICDLVPGALVTEREKQEMLGIKIEGIPDGRRIFLPEDFPEGVYPWRRDETGPDKMIRDLYEVREDED